MLNVDELKKEIEELLRDFYVAQKIKVEKVTTYWDALRKTPSVTIFFNPKS
jgi:hypothetical protein